MKTIWHKLKSEAIIIKCPLCGRQAVPPESTYCPHTLFVYVDPAADDAFFDFMRDDFAAAWARRKLRIPSRRNIASIDVAGSSAVWDVTEPLGYYPTRVVVG